MIPAVMFYMLLVFPSSNVLVPLQVQSFDACRSIVEINVQKFKAANMTVVGTCVDASIAR